MSAPGASGPEGAGGRPVFGYGIWALGYLDMGYGRLVILYMSILHII
jgi:hypothetical protein